MYVNTEIIVLHVTKTGDNSAVIHTLSREYGRRSFIVRGLGKGSVMTLFLPLNILECEVKESSGSGLWQLRKPVLAYPLLGIRDNLYKNSISLFMSEVLYRVIHEGTGDLQLFDWCRQSILLLDAIGSDFSNFHIRFLLELASELGFAPASADLSPFAGEDADVLERFLEEPFVNSMLIPMSGDRRARVADALLRYISYHTDSSVNVNSLKVLHEIFQ